MDSASDQAEPAPDVQPGMGDGTGCDHCGKFVGVASCGCGQVYQCDLLKKWCGKKRPIDDFVSLLRRELNEANYQCCGDCRHNTTTPSPG